MELKPEGKKRLNQFREECYSLLAKVSFHGVSKPQVDALLDSMSQIRAMLVLAELLLNPKNHRKGKLIYGTESWIVRVIREEGNDFKKWHSVQLSESYISLLKDLLSNRKEYFVSDKNSVIKFNTQTGSQSLSFENMQSMLDQTTTNRYLAEFISKSINFKHPDLSELKSKLDKIPIPTDDQTEQTQALVDIFEEELDQYKEMPALRISSEYLPEIGSPMDVDLSQLSRPKNTLLPAGVSVFEGIIDIISTYSKKHKIKFTQLKINALLQKVFSQEQFDDSSKEFSRQISLWERKHYHESSGLKKKQLSGVLRNLEEVPRKSRTVTDHKKTSEYVNKSYIDLYKSFTDEIATINFDRLSQSNELESSLKFYKQFVCDFKDKVEFVSQRQTKVRKKPSLAFGGNDSQQKGSTLETILEFLKSFDRDIKKTQETIKKEEQQVLFNNFITQLPDLKKHFKQYNDVLVHNVLRSLDDVIIDILARIWNQPLLIFEEFKQACFKILNQLTVQTYTPLFASHVNLYKPQSWRKPPLSNDNPLLKNTSSTNSSKKPKLVNEEQESQITPPPKQTSP